MGSGSGQQGHQVFLCTLHTPVPDLSFIGVDVIGAFESIRPAIQAAVDAQINVGVFVSNGFQAVQQASAKNLSFILSPADSQIPFTHVDIGFQADIITDISWVEAVGLIGIVGGITIAIAGILTGQPWIVAAGIIIAIGSILITVVEQLREVVGGVNPIPAIWAFLTSPLGLVVVGVGVGFFIWTSSGRRFVGSTVRKAGPYVRKGASTAGGRIKRGNGKTIDQIGNELTGF